MSTSAAPLALRYRLAVFSRVAAAAFGGYVCAAAAAAMLSVTLPLPRVDAVLTATLVSFLVQAAAAVWVFACANAWRAWLGLIAFTLPMALVAWLAGAWQ